MVNADLSFVSNSEEVSEDPYAWKKKK